MLPRWGVSLIGIYRQPRKTAKTSPRTLPYCLRTVKVWPTVANSSNSVLYKKKAGTLMSLLPMQFHY